MWFLTLSMMLLTGNFATQDLITIFDFSQPEHARFWFIVDDGVMGGVSQGQWETENDYAVFAGEVSLKNNGGFSSVRATFNPANLSQFAGIELQVRGDGHRYAFNLSDVHSRLSYRLTFATDADVETDTWETIRIPFSDLGSTRFGRQVRNAPPINLERVRSMSILISDEQEGPFRLEIGTISVYREVHADV